MILTPYTVDQKSMLNPMAQAAGLCSMMTVKTADCAPPTKLIHVVSDSWAGYLFNVNAYNFQRNIICICRLHCCLYNFQRNSILLVIIILKIQTIFSSYVCCVSNCCILFYNVVIVCHHVVVT